MDAARVGAERVKNGRAGPGRVATERLNPAQVDVGRVGAWLAANVPDVMGPVTVALIAAGRSNLTYRVRDAAGRTLVLRRPPSAAAGAVRTHDIGREHRVLAALARSGLAVPQPRALCRDASVLGASFLVMEHVDGVVLRTRADADGMAESARAGLAGSVARALLSVHAVNVRAAGLANLSAHDGYLHRQLRRWRAQLGTGAPGQQFAGRDDLLNTYRVLAAAVPVQQGVSVVHGDFRVDNLVLRPDGSVAAVLDWELATLGDPLADLGILLASWAQAGDDPVLTIAELEPTRASRVGSRAELIAAYAAGTDLDLTDVRYYESFGLWKLACVLHGVQVRYAAGAVAGDLAGAEQLGRIVARLAAAAHDHARAVGGRSSLDK
jgi:aminoglycoside phosphotransferase (APT) family kinase protein